MKFKIGDKVKFLNATGGGVVTRILNNGIVEVTGDDEFAIPVMAKEIILVDRSGGVAASLFNSQTETTIQPGGIGGVRGELQAAVVPGKHNGLQLEKGLYMAFRPMDQNILTLGDLEVLLINHTSTPLHIQIYLSEKEEHKYHKHFDIPACHSLIAEQISREMLSTRLKGVFQVLARPSGIGHLPLPIHTTFSLKSDRFFKAENYNNTSLDPYKIIFFLLKKASYFSPPPKSMHSEVEAKQKTTTLKHGYVSKTEPFIKQYIIEKGVAEIDLHLHALTNDSQKLSPHEALDFQIGWLRKVINSAISEKISKLIVIHGVGAGVLKTAIKKEISDIRFASSFDAPLSKYGTGATVIEFYHTKNK